MKRQRGWIEDAEAEKSDKKSQNESEPSTDNIEVVTTLSHAVVPQTELTNNPQIADNVDEN